MREIKTNKEAPGRWIHLVVIISLAMETLGEDLNFPVSAFVQRTPYIKCYIADTDCRCEEGGKKVVPKRARKHHSH